MKGKKLNLTPKQKHERRKKQQRDCYHRRKQIPKIKKRMRESCKRYYHANKGKIKKRYKKWYDRNKKKVALQKKQHNAILLVKLARRNYFKYYSLRKKHEEVINALNIIFKHIEIKGGQNVKSKF